MIRMSLLKTAVVGFLAVMVSVVVAWIAVFSGLPSPVPSLAGTAVLLSYLHWVMRVSKRKEKSRAISIGC